MCFLVSGYREHEAEHRKKEAESIKEPVPLREKKPRGENDADLPKRQGDGPKEARVEAIRRAKDGYNAKAQNSTNDPQNLTKSDSFLSKCKALNSESAKQMINIEYNLARNKQAGTDPARLKL